jgi:predicted nuclease of predicted toxin-antitoxin system
MTPAHVGDVGLGAASDQSVFRHAARDQRIVVTADLDFGDILAGSGTATVSVLLLRLRDTSPANSLRRITSILADAGDALAAGAVVIVAENRIRIRSLPIAP